MAELARWRSHKVVQAGKVIAISDQPAVGYKRRVTVEGADGKPIDIDVHVSVFLRGLSNIGDYFVIYDDNYQSWSPAGTFDQGYARLS